MRYNRFIMVNLYKSLCLLIVFLQILSINAQTTTITPNIVSTTTTTTSSSSTTSTTTTPTSAISPSTVCPDGSLNAFEIITGHVFQAPSESMTMFPGTLQLTDCIAQCDRNNSCKAVNFETGLCIILSASALGQPTALTTSQFPVFTIYAQKICIPKADRQLCNRPWTFERVIGYELRKFEKRKEKVDSLESCMSLCLRETSFVCRSANYDSDSGVCSMSDMDRHTITPSSEHSRASANIASSSSSSKYFAPAATANVDYIENNCVKDPKKMCEFKTIPNKILKTVDTVHLDVKTVEDCKVKCLESPYRCFSFDFGDPSNRVCRTSHLDRASLVHIEDPYLDVEGSATYELSSCYDVNIVCKAKEMKVSVLTNKLFSGKIYAKTKPNSCVNDVTNTLDFDIIMPFHDLMCDVKQRDSGKFSNDIIIQHHDMVVTTKDLGLSINCNYDLSNKSITNHQPINVDGTLLDQRHESDIHSQVVASPNVTMRIVDNNGEDISTAQVGDSLFLRFQITDDTSPYQIFVRELVAVDGVDTSDIMLIDNMGCPTDGTIIKSVEKIEEGGKQHLQVPFEAFKFPTSDMVQFRALVTPCITRCDPVHCSAQGLDGKVEEKLSYGRRRRSAKLVDDNELVMTQAIRITDSFGFKKNNNKDDLLNELLLDSNDKDLITKMKEDIGDLPIMSSNNKQFDDCLNVTSMTIACVVFLFIQSVMIFLWAFCWFKRSKISDDKASFIQYPFTDKHQTSTLNFNPTFLPRQRLVLSP